MESWQRTIGEDRLSWGVGGCQEDIQRYMSSWRRRIKSKRRSQSRGRDRKKEQKQVDSKKQEQEQEHEQNKETLAYLCRGPRTYWRSRRPRLARRRGTSKERQSRDLHLGKRG